MDPLILADGASSLAVTAGKISSALLEALESGRSQKQGPDKAISTISSEIGTLNENLQSVDKTLRECHVQSLTLAHVDDSLWNPIGNTMMDCKATLEALDNALSSVKSTSQSKMLWRRSNIHARLAERAREMEAFANKVYKSNCALQVVLGVIQVSLSLRSSNDTSQDFLWRELGSLQKIIENALGVSRMAGFSNDPFAAQISRNLLSLAKAANRFHVQASTTASTNYGGNLQSTWGGSVAGELTEFQRERIERWNQLQPVLEGTEGGSGSDTVMSASPRPQVTNFPPDGLRTPGERPRGDQGGSRDSDTDDMDLDIVNNFEELAQECLASGAYEKAEPYLRKAIERSSGGAQEQDKIRLLRIKLAVCLCLQEKWEASGEVLGPLSRIKIPSNLATFHMLHVIAISQLQSRKLEDASKACKAAVQGRKRLSGKTSIDYYESLQLLADVYDKRGDPLEAEAVRHSLPGSWRQAHRFDYVNPRQCLLGRPELAALLSKGPTDKLITPITPGEEPRLELPGSISLGPMQATTAAAKGKEWSRGGAPRLSLEAPSPIDLLGRQVGEMDTGKEIVGSSPPFPTSSEAGRFGAAPPVYRQSMLLPSSDNLLGPGITDTVRPCSVDDRTEYSGGNDSHSLHAKDSDPLLSRHENLKYVFRGLHNHPSWISGSGSGSGIGSAEDLSDSRSMMSLPQSTTGSPLPSGSLPPPPPPPPHRIVRAPLSVPRYPSTTAAAALGVGLKTTVFLMVDGVCLLAVDDHRNKKIPNAVKISRSSKGSDWSIKWYATRTTNTGATMSQTVKAEPSSHWANYSMSMLRLMEAEPPASPPPPPKDTTASGSAAVASNSSSTSSKKLDQAEQAVKECILDLSHTFWTAYRAQMTGGSAAGLEAIKASAAVVLRLPDQMVARSDRLNHPLVSSLLTGTGLNSHNITNHSSSGGATAATATPAPPSFVVPQSLAVASNFLYSQAAPAIATLGGREHQAIVVMHCGSVLVETASYQLVTVASETQLEENRLLVELEKSGSAVFGTIHVEIAFRTLMRRKLVQLLASGSPPLPTTTTSSSPAKPDKARIDALERRHFPKLFRDVLATFQDVSVGGGGGGGIVAAPPPRTVRFPLLLPPRSSMSPTTTPDAGGTTATGGNSSNNTRELHEQEYEQLVIEISSAEARACFEPTVRRIRKTMEVAVLRARGMGHNVIHVVVGGSFSSSAILLDELRSACARMPGLDGVGVDGIGSSSSSGTATVTLHEYNSLRTPRLGTLHHVLAQAVALD